MSEPTTTPTRDPFLHAINHCIQAYREVKASLPEGAGYTDSRDNHDAACKAYLARLPILFDPESFQLYVACIAHGASLGVIDPVDVGRFCHLAQTAMSAWKLANLTVPAARLKERQAQNQAQKRDTPLPPKGNHDEDESSQPVDQASQYALSQLPAFEVQKQHFQSLRKRGIVLPSDRELRDNPLAALHFCLTAEHLLRQDALAANPPRPQPASQPAPDPLENAPAAA